MLRLPTFESCFEVNNFETEKLDYGDIITTKGLNELNVDCKSKQVKL